MGVIGHPRLLAFASAILAVAALAAVPATARADIPTTVPTNVAVSGSTGVVTFHADSTAPMVRFELTDAPGLAPVVVADGAASIAWPSWGFPNGTREVTAADCNDVDTCGPPSAAVAFRLATAPPVVTAPRSGATIRGGYTFAATAPSAALAFRIDGATVGYATHRPFSFSYRGILAHRLHTVQAVECSAGTTRCTGPVSSAVRFTAAGLHPAITSVRPGVFSPNRDGVKDTTSVSIYLPESQTVRISVLNSASSAVRSVDLGALSGGTLRWTWSGRRDSGVRAGDGVYTVKVTTAKTINGVSVSGTASRRVRLDTAAPRLTSVAGNWARVYPYRDGYRDSVAPAVTMGEGGRLTLVVKNSAGTTVRTVQGSRYAGRHSLTWNGRDSSSRVVPAGTYRWTFTATDSVGNHRTTASYFVAVSAKRLVARSTTITRNGDSYYSAGARPAYCGQYFQSLSEFPNGVWLDNVCDDRYDDYSITVARYSFAVPGAVRYGSMSVQAFGVPTINSVPSKILAGYLRTSGSSDLRFARAGSTARQWYRLGSASGAGHVTSDGHVRVAVGVDDSYNVGGSTSAFDLGLVRLTLGYYLLR